MPNTMTIPRTTQRPLFGIGLMVVAMLALPIMDAAAKYMSARIPTLQLVWARFFFHTWLLIPIALWHHPVRELFPHRAGLQTVRALMILCATALFFKAVALLPLADTLAVFFIYPFIITAFAPWVLGDRVGVWRWTATIIGFIGALVIIQPGFATLTHGVLFAIGAGFSYSFYALSTRKLAGIDPPLVTLFFTGLIGLVVTSVLLPFAWVAPQTGDWMLMAVMGLVSAAGHYCVILASESAPTPLLAPLAYVEIISATLLGYFIFADLPDRMTWIGIAIIVASGIVIAWREKVRGIG